MQQKARKLPTQKESDRQELLAKPHQAERDNPCKSADVTGTKVSKYDQWEETVQSFSDVIPGDQAIYIAPNTYVNINSNEDNDLLKEKTYSDLPFDPFMALNKAFSLFKPVSHFMRNAEDFFEEADSECEVSLEIEPYTLLKFFLCIVMFKFRTIVVGSEDDDKRKFHMYTGTCVQNPGLALEKLTRETHFVFKKTSTDVKHISDQDLEYSYPTYSFVCIVFREKGNCCYNYFYA